MAHKNCPKFEKILEDRFSDDEYLRISNFYKNFTIRLEKATGLKNLKFEDIQSVYSTVNIQKIHNLLTKQEIIDIFPELQKVAGVSLFEAYNRNTMGKLIGGNLLLNIITEMKNFLPKNKKLTEDYKLNEINNNLNEEKIDVGDSSSFIFGKENIKNNFRDDVPTSKLKFIHYSLIFFIFFNFFLLIYLEHMIQQ
jgi:hypothetical protein